MKDNLDAESREALVAYRLERASETLKEVQVLKKESFYNTAISRLYYACFYAASALLLQNGITAQTHQGVKTMLGMHFIATGKLPADEGKTFATLFEKRQNGDYDDFVYCDEQMVDELYPRAIAFIQAIKELISKK